MNVASNESIPYSESSSSKNITVANTLKWKKEQKKF